MESKTLILKPVLWRLFVKLFLNSFIPSTIGILIAQYLYLFLFHKPFSLFWQFILSVSLGALIGAIIFSLILIKEFNILISGGKISGPNPSRFIWDKEVFSITDLDVSNLNKQSFYEKINSFRTIRSINGQKIMIKSFIYGSSELNEFYRILENESLQSTQQ